MNKKVDELPTRGPWSKFIIDDPKNPSGGEKIVGKLSIEWGEHLLTGIACDLTSPAFTKMCDSIQEVKKEKQSRIH